MKGNKILYLAGLVIFAFSISTATFAAKSAQNSEQHKWTIGVSGLLMQPTNSNGFYYGTVKTIDSNGGIHSNSEYVNPSYSGAFDVFLRYNFIESAKDLTISYSKFSATDTSNTSTPLSPNYIYTKFYQTAQGKVKNEIDTADIFGGQHFNINDAVDVHAVGGIGYAHFYEKITDSYDAGLGNVPNVASESYYNETTSFHGTGPKLGADASYIVNNSNFSVVGGLTAALLVGSKNYSNSTIVIGGTNLYTSNSSITTTVTNVNANLGLRYQFRNNSKAQFAAELGYRVNEYINYVSIAGGYLTLSSSFA